MWCDLTPLITNCVGASDDVEIDTDPYESVDRQNQPAVHIDMGDDAFSSVSSRSSLVSNAPSVQHFNISVCNYSMQMNLYSLWVPVYCHVSSQGCQHFYTINFILTHLLEILRLQHSKAMATGYHCPSSSIATHVNKAHLGLIVSHTATMLECTVMATFTDPHSSVMTTSYLFS